jgi:hypothetical protein
VDLTNLDPTFVVAKLAVLTGLEMKAVLTASEAAFGQLKGKCALGPFLSILVIKCPTQMVMC